MKIYINIFNNIFKIIKYVFNINESFLLFKYSLKFSSVLR